MSEIEKSPEEDSTVEQAASNNGDVPAQALNQATAQLGDLNQQVAEFRDKYLRGLADSENMRKRLQKEKEDVVQYALQNAIADFLSPIDHLENALKFADQATPEIQHWATGFQMILTQFKEALSNQGAVPFISVGTHFDPHCHEAIEMVITEEFAPGTVVEESLKGYKMGNRVIRPARVKVAKLAPVEDAEAADPTEIQE